MNYQERPHSKIPPKFTLKHIINICVKLILWAQLVLDHHNNQQDQSDSKTRTSDEQGRVLQVIRQITEDVVLTASNVSATLTKQLQNLLLFIVHIRRVNHHSAPDKQSDTPRLQTAQ